MYLKRLELQGFKSFPDKIKLEFNKGITAVVGPNGSGKSNISDAVRWVLGEKSAKSLRGTKMEDVIFNGTANRKPLSFAEVSLVLDNEDRKLNLDYSEITVTRRVFRSGDSDYLINGSKCRAKDILELFMDTGVGKEGYSIIGQGRIDEILSSKSEDRRQLFEEAAGIVKYRTRCVEASNKLAREQENLVRVNDIIDELEKQVGPLAIQAEKAKKCIVLADRMKLVQVNIFVRDAEKYEKELKELNVHINQLNIDIETEARTEEKYNNQKLELKNNLNEIELRLDEHTSGIADMRSAKEQKENDIRLCNQEIEHFNENINRINEENSQGVKSINDKKALIDDIQHKLADKENELKNKQTAYNNKIDEFSKISSRVSENEEQLNHFNNIIIDKMNNATDVKNEISKSEAMVGQVKKRKDQLDEELSALLKQQSERNNILEDAENEIDNINTKAKEITATIEKNTQQLSDIKVHLTDANNRQQVVTKTIQEKNARLRALSDLEKNYEGYFVGVKAVLNQRDNKNPDFKGICGAVGEAINCDKKYETAIEIALGSAVQNIIARTEDDVKKAINYLKKNNKGRATFFPMTAIKPKSLGNEKYNIINEKGVIGIAKELIEYSPEYENIMSSLLERVIIADNMDNAVLLARKTKYAYKIVTIEGELLNAGGSMTGGSINKKSTGIFSRGREITELRNALKEFFEEQSAINNDIEKMTEIYENLRYKINESKEELQRLAISKTETLTKLSQTKEYAQDISGRINNFNEELTQLENTINVGNARIEELNKTLDEINAEINDTNNKLNDFQSQIQSDRDIRESSNEVLSSMRVEINQLENNIYTFNVDIKRINEEINEVESNMFNSKNLIEEYQNKIAEKKFETSQLEINIADITEKYDMLVRDNQEYIAEKNNINTKLEKLDVDIKKQLETKSRLEKELDRLELRKENTDNKCRQLYDSMWEEYEITYVAAKDSEKLNDSTEELKKEEKKLRNEIRALGNVNLNAVEEYAEVKERYDFLKNNRDDIIKTEKELTNIINDLNNMMEVQFKEQFAIISENFTKTFAEMFGGGSAELKLGDTDDILNCGIDIVVQPPGKSLQNMMLLSGGEKALTAMALLFAILKMKPSPFCILDEIEAALDDANVNRYANYLSKFINDTQFIVITHRKGTMEAADILYGVTMQEQGVSKLVSVKFNEGGVQL
ncbi:MAG: chromosome segregation protein SMC [Lachnospirales bacterium]